MDRNVLSSRMKTTEAIENIESKVDSGISDEEDSDEDSPKRTREMK